MPRATATERLARRLIAELGAIAGDRPMQWVILTMSCGPWPERSGGNAPGYVPNVYGGATDALAPMTNASTPSAEPAIKV
jgi:hypothetical protein